MHRSTRVQFPPSFELNQSRLGRQLKPVPILIDALDLGSTVTPFGGSRNTHCFLSSPVLSGIRPIDLIQLSSASLYIFKNSYFFAYSS